MHKRRRENFHQLCVQNTSDIMTIAVRGHTEGEWTETKVPTCTEAGTKELHCTVCMQILGIDTIAIIGHQYDSWVVTKQPSVTEESEKSRECSVYHDVEISPIEATGIFLKIIVTGSKYNVGSTEKILYKRSSIVNLRYTHNQTLLLIYTKCLIFL